MSDYCDLLKKKAQDLDKERRNLVRDYLAIQHGLDPKAYTPETIVDEMVNNRGYNREALEAEMRFSRFTEEGQLHLKQMSGKVGDQAISNVKDLMSANGAKNAWQTVRDGLSNWYNKAINSIPKNGNAALGRMLETIAGWRNAVGIGTGKDGKEVYAGEMMVGQLRQEGEALLKNDEVKNTAGNLSMGELGKILNMLGMMRGLDFAATVKRARSEIAKAGDKSVLKNLTPLLDLAERGYKSKSIREFMDKYYDRLDTAAKFGTDKGIFHDKEMEDGTIQKASEANYYHNTVALEESNPNPIERALEGREWSFSNFLESKRYKHGIDFMLSGKGMPASFDFFDNAGRYWKNFGRIARNYTIRDVFKANATMGDNEAGKLLLRDGDKLSSAVSLNPDTKTGDGRYYQNLESVRRSLAGLYVHPDLYAWMNNSVGTSPLAKMGGAARTFIAWNAGLKQTLLSAGYGIFSFHGLSLAKKYAYANVREGLNSWWDIKSGMGRGLEAIKNNDPRLIEGIDHGFNFQQHDSSRISPWANQFDFNTGDRTIRSTLYDYLTKYSNWQHDNLFQHWHAGLKADLYLRMTESTKFEEMVKKVGRDQALSTVAKICNDTMGGQNLELMGRHKGMQAIMQAALLAPDWQESKFRRLFGMAMSDDPNLRKHFLGAVGIELGTVVATSIILEQAYAAFSGEKRGLDDTFNDMILKGRIGSVWAGKSKDGKKDIYARAFGSEAEDFRPFFNLARSIYETSIQNKTGLGPLDRVWKPFVKDLATELKYKSSPLAKFMLDQMEQERTPQMDKFGNVKPAKPTAFDYSMLPIAMQNSIYAARGGFGDTPEEREKYAILTLLAGMAGTPLESKSEKVEGRTIFVPLKKGQPMGPMKRKE